MSRNIVVESRTVNPSIIEETLVSKYPSKMESVQTTYSQSALVHPPVELRENTMP